MLLDAGEINIKIVYFVNILYSDNRNGRLLFSSLCYIAENMIPEICSAPLFEACLELHEPDLVFTPSLDSTVDGNFCSIIQGIIEEIIELSKLMPRISDTKNSRDYFV